MQTQSIDYYQNPCKRAVHPKVQNILLRYSIPSPGRIVSDPSQPITGTLRDKPIPVVEAPRQSALNIEKQEISLNLGMSRMLVRRTSLKK